MHPCLSFQEFLKYHQHASGHEKRDNDCHYHGALEIGDKECRYYSGKPCNPLSIEIRKSQWEYKSAESRNWQKKHALADESRKLCKILRGEVWNDENIRTSLFKTGLLICIEECSEYCCGYHGNEE